MIVIKWLDKNFEKYVLFVLLITITLCLSLNIVMRFFFNNPFAWTDRVAQLSFVISAFFSISYCIRRGSALKIDLLTKKLPESMSRILLIIVKLIMLAAFALLTVGAWGTLNQYVAQGTTDAALGIPLTIIYALILFGFVLTIIRTIQSLVFEFFPEKNPEVIATMIKTVTADDSDESDNGDDTDDKR